MFRKWFREQGFTRDAILDAERERVDAWAKTPPPKNSQDGPYR